MTAFRITAALLPIAAAWCWLRRHEVGTLPERVALAFGLGVALSSCAFFAARWSGLGPRAYMLLEPIVAIAIGLVAVRQSSPAASAPRPDRQRDAGHIAVVAATALMVMALLAMVILLRNTLAHPNGAWDAWMIWNTRGAFLAEPSGAWLDGFDAALAHPDYPLLVPGSVARGWVWVGTRAWWVPASLSVGFTIATAVLLVASVWRRQGAALASASMALLVAPEFLSQGTAQLADVPLAFYAVAAVLLLHDAPVSTVRTVLAGVLCGCAAWTKNEGLVLAVALPAITVLLVFVRRGRAVAADAAADLVIGAGPLLVLLTMFKLMLVPPNDVVSGVLAPGALRYWADTARVQFVLREMGGGLLAWGGWPVQGMTFVLLVVTALGARAPLWRVRPRMSSAAVLLGVQLAGFFAVYVMTPQSVAWHVQTSWPRLITQVWPTMVWWACAALAPDSPLIRPACHLSSGVSDLDQRTPMHPEGDLQETP